MASLIDNPVLEKGTSFHVGSWIFVADGSGGFESHSTDQDPPEDSEAAKHREFDEFINQLEEIRFSDLNNEARIQRNQSQNTFQTGKGFGKTARRFQA